MGAVKALTAGGFSSTNQTSSLKYCAIWPQMRMTPDASLSRGSIAKPSFCSKSAGAVLAVSGHTLRTFRHDEKSYYNCVGSSGLWILFFGDGYGLLRVLLAD